jgi:hypothetical protein
MSYLKDQDVILTLSVGQMKAHYLCAKAKRQNGEWNGKRSVKGEDLKDGEA